ncbi:hypothetical protein ACN28S_49310 [Cystobacter fuscus]
MYCPSCRQERLGGQLCAACGKPMTARSREALEQELAHIRFLLGELPHWDTSSVPKATRNYLTQRYERQIRILDLVLAETVSVAVPAPGEGTPVEIAAPVVVPASIAAPQQVALSAEVLVPPVAPPPPSSSVTEEFPENPLLAAMQASPAEVSPAPKMSFSKPEPETFSSRPEEEEEEELAPLPPVVTEPLFDAPVRRSPTARLVEEVSTWDTVWRPFLYESIGWFIGAFLIVAGSLYLAFDSWAGLTSVSRSLVVFGMTAGYSAAFSICGALLARREALASAGRILGLIGAAVGPLAGLALGPLDSLSLDGIPLYLLLPLLVGWSVAAALLVRKPAESFDVPSRPLLQGALVGTTWMMGLAPLAARLGTSAVWFDLLPCVLFALLARQSLPAPRTSRALAFTLAAPSYLLLLYAVRLHVALAASGTPPRWATTRPSSPCCWPPVRASARCRPTRPRIRSPWASPPCRWAASCSRPRARLRPSSSPRPSSPRRCSSCPGARCSGCAGSTPPSRATTSSTPSRTRCCPRPSAPTSTGPGICAPSRPCPSCSVAPCSRAGCCPVPRGPPRRRRRRAPR